MIPKGVTELAQVENGKQKVKKEKITLDSPTIS